MPFSSSVPRAACSGGALISCYGRQGFEAAPLGRVAHAPYGFLRPARRSVAVFCGGERANDAEGQNKPVVASLNAGLTPGGPITRARTSLKSSEQQRSAGVPQRLLTGTACHCILAEPSSPGNRSASCVPFFRCLSCTGSCLSVGCSKLERRRYLHAFVSSTRGPCLGRS